MIRLLPLLFILATLLPAQHIGVGVKGGVPIIDATKLIDRNLTSIRKGDFVVGPMVELLLPAGLGVELNALYRRGNGVSTLEFPLVGKYRFPGILVRPTISGGFVFQRLTDIPGLDNRKGIIAGGGVEIKLPKLRIGPELRYTRYNRQITGRGFLTGTNQVDLLVGFSF